MTTHRWFASRSFWLCSAVMLASCYGESTGPDRRLGTLPLAPVMAPHALRLVNVGSVHIVLFRPGTSTVVLDTTVVFPPNLDTLSLQLSVPISGNSQQFDLSLDMLDATNLVVFHAGPTTVTAAASGVPNAPVPLVINYVGTGSHAAGVRFTTSPASAFFGDTVTFVAEAFDSQNVVIPNTPILFLSSDSTTARVPDEAVGKVVALAKRGSVQVTAQLLTPPSASKPLVVQPLPNAITITAGNSQSGSVGQALATPVTVHVTAADNLGVQGVVVTYAITGGGGSLSKATDTTNANGDGAVVWTLGTGPGANTMTATAAGISGGAGVATGTATATPGAPKKLVFQVQPANATAQTAINPAIKVAAQDSFGNATAGFTGNVTLTIGNNPSGATLSGGGPIAAVAGVATFSNVQLSNSGSGFTLVAGATGLTPATSTAFNVIGGVPSHLAYTTQPPATATAGSSFNVVLEIRDTANTVVTTATNNVTLAITGGTGTVGAHLLGTTTKAAVAGVASFSVNVDSVGTGYTLTATMTGPPSISSLASTSLNVSSGPASIIGLVSGNLQVATVGASLSSPIVVKVTDALGNAINGQTVTWAVTTGGGSPSTTSTTTNASGLASVTWTTGSATYTQTATATSGSLTGSPVTFTSLGTPPGTTDRWVGSVSTNWSTAGNWSTGIVPTTTDSVFVPRAGSFATNQPVLTGAVSIASLYAEPGSVIDLASSGLTAGGNVSVSSMVASGTGTLALAGTTKNVAGSLPTVLVTGTYTQIGNVTITGKLVINGSAPTLTVGGFFLTTTDSLVQGPSNGTLIMNNAVDSVEIGGNAWFDGTSTSTALTAGVLRVHGTFNVPFATNFQAGPAHRTVLNGSTSQTVSLATPGTSHFGTLEVKNPAGIVWSTDGAIAGSMVIHTGSGSVTGSGHIVTLAGNLLDSIGTAWQVTTTQLTGTPNPRRKLPRNLTSNLVVTGTDTLADTLHVTGKVTINGSPSALVVAGFTLTTTDSLALPSQGFLVMRNAADSVEVGGVAWFNGTGSGVDTLLTAGVLRVHGNFTVATAGNFSAAGTHRTVLNGSSAQTITFSGGSSPSAGAGHFQVLEAANPAGLVWASNGSINGRMIVHPTSGTITGATRTITLSNDLIDSVGTAWQPTLTQLNGTPSPRRKLPRNLVTNLLVTGRDTLADTLHVTGKVTINGSPSALVVAGFTLTTTDSLALPSQGFLVMRNAADSVEVGGVAWFNGTGSGVDTLLTSGVLRVHGNFTVATAGNFSAAGTHRTVLNGSSAQTITFSGGSSPSAGSGHFQVLEAANPAGLVWGSNGAINGRMIVHAGSGTITGATRTITLSSDLIDSVGTAWQPTLTQLNGTPNPRRKLPRSLSSSVFVTGVDTLADTLHVTGGVTINGSGAALVIAGFTLSTTDSLSLPSQGFLVMRNAADSVEVGGLARFNGSGASVDTFLTAGVLRVHGNFTVQTASNFSAAGTHRTVLNGSAAQTVTISSSGQGAGAGHFFNLDVLNTVGGVSFASSAQINGLVRMLGATNVTSTTGAQTILTGLVDASQHWQPSNTIFSGVNPTLPAGITSSVTFTNTVTLTAGLTVTGSLNVASGGNLNLGGQKVTVTGGGVGFNTTGSGVLTMQNVSNLDTLNVQGNIVFGGGDETLLLTNGAIKVLSAFQSSCSTCFVGSGSHTVIFTVTSGPEQVVMTGGGPTGTRFQNVLILGASAGTVSPTAGGMYVAGTLVDSLAGLGGTGTTAVAGAFRQSPNTTVIASSLSLAGTITISPTGTSFNPASLTFAGTSQTIPAAQAGLTYNAVTVSGTATLPVTTTPTMASLTVTGTLTMGGHALKVSGAFATSGTGSLVMSNTADSLDLHGTATFGGGPGTISAGVIRMKGNFVQTGTNSFAASAQSATVANRVVFDSTAGTQTISFADATNSNFQKLIMSKGAGSGITLLTNIHARVFSNTGGTTSLVGSNAGTQFIVDSLFSTAGNITSPLTLVLNGAVCDSAATTADTIVFAGVNQPLTTTGCPSAGFGTITYKSIRVTDSLGAFVGPFTVPVDLVIGSAANPGVVTVPASSTLTVTGKLKTQGNGALRMTTGGNVTVGDSVIFAGGNETGRLTSGTLSVAGHFVQSTNSTSFVASGTHATTINGTTAQTISFANPTFSFFHGLTINKGVGAFSTATFLTDALINNGFTISGSSTVQGPTAHVKVAGGTFTAIQSTTSPTLTMSSLELFAAPAIGSSLVSVSPDTMILSGAITSLPTGTGVVYKSVRVNTTGTLSFGIGGTVTLSKDLDVAAGTAQCSIITLNIGGKLRTRGTGILSMVNGSALVTVTDSAIFGSGSSTSGLLTAGTLTIGGNFVQTGAATSFAASGSHVTVLQGAQVGGQTVKFGSAGNQFQDLFIGHTSAGVAQTSGVTLLSNIVLAGNLRDSGSTNIDSIAGGSFTVTANGMLQAGPGATLVLNNAPLTTNSATLTSSKLTFNAMNANVTQWTINLPSGAAPQFSGLTFNTTPTSPGLYFAAQLSSVGSATLAVNSPVFPSAATLNGGSLYKTINGNGTVSTTWGGTSLTNH